MPPTVKLAEYLFTRLHQLGIQSIHGVPGDFNLELLDFVEPTLRWIGSCNELNAGYAANGYSRINGLGALITTFGVGELSAVNAIAGAFAERVPIIHIVGTPNRAVQDNRTQIHHTFNDGNFRRFALIHAQITIAQANLIDPRTSPAQIDAVLEQCLIHHRPVYIEVPVDMVTAEVSAARLASPISIPEPIPPRLQPEALALVLQRIKASQRPMIFVDGETNGLGLRKELHELLEKTHWPTWTSPFGKGIVDETLPNFHGVYMGKEKMHQKSFIDACDLILVFGPHFSTTNSFQKTAVPNPAVSISFTHTAIQIGDRKFEDMLPKQFLVAILQALDGIPDVTKYKPYPELETPQGLVRSTVLTPGDGPLTQKEFYLRLSPFVRPGDVVLGETGTAGYGTREFALPRDTWYMGPVTWLSIGQMLPAAQGAALAQHEREVETSKAEGGSKTKPGRTILLIGDGSLQMTVQELSTIIRENLNVVVFVLNNNGYTIERCIHGVNQKYNDVATWRYLEAPSFFGAKESAQPSTFTVRNWADLSRVMADKNLADGEGLRMVEVFLDQDDAPAGLLRLLALQLEAQKSK
ncbi:pyruvate decarboxylase [Coleophoma cylindrospora]|uniref:Pyruvate decarboxylase n=1 Tax=Coleophoma cylindrospora TaxID=1849047 RepID=A0A3D8RFT4_9HELO|nr:pyruvate decarboxylase [Coleophoma cylindrospora]